MRVHSKMLAYAILSCLLIEPGLSMVSSSANGEDSTTHPSIRIEGNDQFASVARAENWPGEGTADDPYIIENLTLVILGEETGIYIANTNCYFELRNCSVRNPADGTSPSSSSIPDPYMPHSGHGITMVNVTNATLSNIDCSFLRTGILLDHCDLNHLRAITGTYDDKGIALSYSDNNTLENIAVSRSYYRPYTFGDTNIVEWSDVYLNCSCNNTIRNARCWADGGVGLGLSQSEDNLIIGTSASAYMGQSILILDSDNNTLDHCVTSDRGGMVKMVNSNNVTIESGGFYGLLAFSISSSKNVIIRNNTYDSARLVDCNHCLFINNTCVGGSEYGICLESSDDNAILSNNFRSCSMNGVLLFKSNHNMVVNNKVDNGVYSDSSTSNLIENNTISRWYDFTENEAWNVANKEYSYSLKFHNSFNNTIIGNRMRGESPILYNVSRAQAFDDGSNIWNSSTEGNYWEDWTRPDQNNDGIVDRPYLIDGGNNSDRLPIAGDRLDLVYDVEPSLTIVSPSDREVARATTVTITWNVSYDPSEAFMSVMVDCGEWQYLGITSKVTLDLDEGEHTVQVAACDQNGEHQLLESVTFVFEPMTSEPTLVGVRSEYGGVNLSWEPPLLRGDSVTHYAIYRDDVMIATTIGTWYNDTGMEYMTSHEYYITAFNANGESEASRTITAWPFPLVVEKPSADNSSGPSPDPSSNATSLPSDGSGSLTTEPAEGTGDISTAEAIAIGSTLIAVAAVGAVLLRSRKT